jgi:type IV pilus assembly protein PilX
MTCPATPSTVPAFKTQHGAALIIAMILLLVMSLLAVASLRGTIMQERMSSNAYDQDLAFQSAEAGLRVGERLAENWVNAGGNLADLAGCQAPNAAAEGLYQNINNVCQQPLWDVSTPGANDAYWQDASTVAGAIPFGGVGLSLAPFFIVELISNAAPCQPDTPAAAIPNCRRFRITASSNNADGRSQVILQSIYATE